MKNKKLFIAALFLTGTLLFTGCGQANDASSNTSSAENITTEQSSSSGKTNSSDDEVFSNMSTTDLDGNEIDSSIFADNKVTLVNVWNVGCTPCVNEIPDLDRLNTEYKGKGASILGLYCDLGAGISDDEMAQIKDILADADASYTQLRMTGTLATNDRLLNLMAFPTTYVVDSDGTILDTLEGSKDYDGWKSVIDSYLSDTDAL